MHAALFSPTRRGGFRGSPSDRNVDPPWQWAKMTIMRAHWRPPAKGAPEQAFEETCMRKSVVAGAVLAAALAIGASTNRAAAMSPAPRPDLAPAPGVAGFVQKIYFHCGCARDWPHRRYWRWDSRPTWDDPWAVLRPNFWGSPEPRLVPADDWARKWHPPWFRYWRWHNRHWRHRR